MADSDSKVKQDVKARLTLSATGKGGGEGPRTHAQVLATSGVASLLVLLHIAYLNRQFANHGVDDSCWAWSKDILVPGIVA